MKEFGDLKLKGYSTEQALDFLIQNYNYLLHGSRVDIEGNFLTPNEDNDVFATDLGAIALLKSIISNKGLVFPGVCYPYHIDENNPLEVRIHGLHENTIGKEGFIYVIENTSGFENNPEGSWQYIKTGSEVPFIEKIKVYRADFTYPIYDAFKDELIE